MSRNINSCKSLLQTFIGAAFDAMTVTKINYNFDVITYDVSSE